MTAVGVASPRAQGQATVTTEIQNTSPKTSGVWLCSRGVSHDGSTAPRALAMYQPMNVRVARLMTVGVKSDAMRSA